MTRLADWAVTLLARLLIPSSAINPPTDETE